MLILGKLKLIAILEICSHVFNVPLCFIEHFQELLIRNLILLIIYQLQMLPQSGQNIFSQKIYIPEPSYQKNIQTGSSVNNQIEDSWHEHLFSREEITNQAAAFYNNVATNKLPEYRSIIKQQLQADNQFKSYQFSYVLDDTRSQHQKENQEISFSKEKDNQQQAQQLERFTKIYIQMLKGQNRILQNHQSIEQVKQEVFDVLSFFQNRKLTVGYMRKFSRDTSRLWLLASVYIHRLDQICEHDDKLICNYCMENIKFIHQSRISQFAEFFSEDKNLMLQSFLESSYKTIVGDIQKPKTKNKSKKKKK